MCALAEIGLCYLELRAPCTARGFFSIWVKFLVHYKTTLDADVDGFIKNNNNNNPSFF